MLFSVLQNTTVSFKTEAALRQRLIKIHHMNGFKTIKHMSSFKTEMILRQTNRNSNSVINDCTYIKTINILNIVSINKKKLPG